MKKYYIGGIVAIGIISLVALSRFKPKPSAASAKTPSKSTTAKSVTVTATTSSTTPSTSSPSATMSTTKSTVTAPTTTTVPSGQYKNGSYTGSAEDVGYGTVQVKAVISGGKLTNVKFVQMPAGGHSSEVTAMAEPQLLSEALAAQSGNVNIVSGATQDSLGFQASLTSALNQAS